MTATTKKDVRKPMKEVMKGLEQTSQKIRALTAAGFTRSEIVKDAGIKTKNGDPIRYQHVRNVLVTPLVGDTK